MLDPHWTSLATVDLAGHRLVTASRAELADAMAWDCAAARAAPGRPRLVFSMNGQGLSMARTDAAFAQALEEADILHADGGFLVSLSRWRTANPIAERSATTDMIHDFASRAARDGLGFYLLGATEENNRACAEILARSYPGLQIVGRRNGYFARDELPAIAADINAAGTDVLWVGLGKPHEQILSVELSRSVRCGWLVTCGGCFNFISGHYSRAPGWMQSANLEWLYRLVTRPRQLFWRYVVTTPHALWIALSSPGRPR